MGVVIMLRTRGQGASLGTVSYVTHTIAHTSSTVTGSASIQSGDLLIYSDRGYGKAVPTEVIPTGFTLISSIEDGIDTRHMLSYKIATGSEASTAITGFDTFGGIKILAVFRAESAFSSIDVQDVAGQATGANPAAQVVESGSGTAPILALGAFGSYQNDIAETMSGATFIEVSGAGSSGERSTLGYRIMTTPSDVTVDMPDEGGSNTLISCYLNLS